MYPITNEVKALFEAEQRKVLRITGTDKNGATISITDDNVIEDSFQIDRYSCNGEKLEVGTAIAAQMSFTLENGSGQYDGIVFEDAELFAEVGIADWTQSSPTITYVPCGYFTPDNQPRRLSTISITALDRMTLFDVVVDAADLTFPTTIAGMVGQVCTVCGVTLAQSISGLVNAGVAVTELPTVQGEITYRNLIQWCAGIMGTNAWFDWNGQLRFSWYENATGYVSTVDNRYSSDLYEDDLTVSGVEYTNNSGIVIVEGTDDYAIDLTGNAIAGPLVATVLSPLNTALNGFTYRPFTAATVNAPYLWPMDVVTFTDKDGNDHTSALTNVAFGLNGTTAMESKGMTYAINKLAQPKGFTREQAQLVNQAMEHVEQDIDESLTQQEIFNRLTDNGAAQGLVLYNGQLYINASYINAGYLNVGRIDFNDPPTYCNVPDENDVDSLFSGQTVVDGWIVNASGTGQITIISCGFALPLHGKTVSVTFEYNGQLLGGSDSWYGISDEVEQVGGFRDWEMPAGQTPINPYTLDFYVDNDMTGFSMSVECSGVRRISVSLDSPVTPTKDIVYDYRGQRIGTFQVYRDGMLVTYEKSLFNGPVRIGELFLNNPLGVDYGGTGADNAADARSNLGITPANIGALPLTGGTLTGQLTVPEKLTVKNNTTTQDIELYANADGTSGLYINKDGTYSKAVVGVDASGNATFYGNAFGSVDSNGMVYKGQRTADKSLDAIHESGYWECVSNNLPGGIPTDAPNTHSLVINYRMPFVDMDYQIYIAFSQGLYARYERRYYGTWSPWRKVQYAT